MTTPSSHADRLLKRYPDLHVVPAGERKALVRATLMHPLVILPFLLLALWGLPSYVQILLPLVDAWDLPLSLGLLLKLVAGVILPVWGITFVFGKVLIPPLLRRAMRKRGFLPKD